MPVSGRLFAVVLTLAFGSAYAAETAQDPLTTPDSPLYQPSPEVRAQVREVMGAQRSGRPLPQAAAETEPVALPDLSGDNPVPRGLIAVAQRELGALGYDAGPIDGRMGPKTRNALITFQTDKGLPADGRLTFDVLAKLMVRQDPEAASPPPPPPPPPPAVAQWSVRQSLGKTVHAQAGDLLGTVGGFVVGADRIITGMVIDTTNGYGTHQGKALVPFAQVGHAITRPAIILPLSAQQALPLRDKAQTITLADGQWLLEAPDEEDKDVTADTDGQLLDPPAGE